MAKTAAEIAAYYNETQSDYEWLLAPRAGALHYGFWTKGVSSLEAALLEENRLLSLRSGICKTDYVLDAGCGIGGSAHWLAENTGCRVSGITVVPAQAQEATRRSVEKGLANHATFSVADFTRIPFRDATFTVVWAVESVCHALRKADFLQEAFRVLKPGGRLIVADVLTPRSFRTPWEDYILRTWVKSWGVEDLDSVARFTRSAEQVGFELGQVEDVTDLVVPTSRWLFGWSLPGMPVSAALELVHLRSRLQTMNACGAFLQYLGLQLGYWKYWVVTAVKP